MTVETIKIEIDKSFTETAETALIKFAENIELIGILKPSSFWHDEGTTFKEALKDEFQLPITRLRNLKNIIGKIKTDDPKINELAKSLKQDIDIQIKKILKGQDGIGAIDQASSQYGGIDAYFRLMSAMGANTSFLYEEFKMEESLKQRIIDLQNELKIINDEALANIFTLQDLPFKREDISETERKELVDYTNKVLVESFKKHYIGSDSTIKNQIIEKFLLDEM